MPQLGLVGLVGEREGQHLRERQALEHERRPAGLAAGDPLAFDEDHERRGNVGNAVGFGAQRVRRDACGAQLAEPRVHALLRDGGDLRRSGREPRADRERHLVDVVRQRLLERERRDLPQACLARGGQRGLRGEHVDGVHERRAAPAGERRVRGL